MYPQIRLHQGGTIGNSLWKKGGVALDRFPELCGLANLKNFLGSRHFYFLITALGVIKSAA